MGRDELLENKCYATWASLRSRARGARAVNLVPAWHDYETFKRDMYPPLLDHVTAHGLKNTTLLRIDKRKAFGPGNARWGTWAAQARARQQGTTRHMCKCGHVWRSRLVQPKACPRCKRYDLHRPINE